jgi:hypothetical protein
MQPTTGRISLVSGVARQDWHAGVSTAAGAGQQQQQLGYGQAEHAHVMTAIRQVGESARLSTHHATPENGPVVALAPQQLHARTVQALAPATLLN